MIDNSQTPMSLCQFEALVERMKDIVYRLAFTYMKNKEDAEDVYQIVFEKYLCTRPEFENAEHERAWFIRVTVNICKNQLTCSWRKNTVYSEEIEDDNYNRESFRRYEENSEDCENEELLQALLKLPAKYSVVIHLYYYEEYETGEIAKIMGISKATVLMRLSRARKQLKSMLGGDCFEN